MALQQSTASTDLRTLNPLDSTTSQAQKKGDPTQTTTALSGDSANGPATKTPPEPASIAASNLVEDGLPDKEALEHMTEEDTPHPDDAGNYTDDLSDMSEGDEDIRQATRQTNAFTTWYYRIQPLVRNKRVRFYAAANFILFLLNVILIIALIAMTVIAIIAGIQARHKLNIDKPCLYEFSEWSACSATCMELNQPELNYKTRHVIPDTIVVARGKFARQAPCPPKLESLTEKAPCNTHVCPRNLSSFSFGPDCMFRDPTDHNKGCYKIRNVPIGDHAIIIDVDDLTRSCDCPGQPNAAAPNMTGALNTTIIPTVHS